MIIERLPTEEYIHPSADIGYVDINSHLGLFDKVAFEADMVLSGPKGIGKSMSVFAFAAAKKYPIVTFDCSEDIRRSHLIGSFILRGNDTPFILGPITTAFEIANELGRCIVNFEELNSLLPSVQKILNSSTDFRRRLEVPECKKVFRLREGAKIWFTGSMNTSNYAGVHALNEDLKSRFRILDVAYPTPGDELIILSKQVPIRGEVTDRVLKSLCALAQESRQKDAMDYALSTRDLVQIGSDAGKLGLGPALKIALGKFDGQDKMTIRERMKSQFAAVSL